MPSRNSDINNVVQHEVIKETPGLPVCFTPCYATAKPPRSVSRTVPLHWHEFAEILYMLGDSLQATVENETFRLRQGDLLIINSGEFHSTVIPRLPGEYILLQISEKRLRELFSDFELLHFDNLITAGELESEPRIRELLLSMARLYDEHENGYQLLFNARFYEFLHILYKRHSRSIAPVTIDSAAGRDKNRILEIIEWTEQHYSERLTLEDAAARLGITREYFCRIFKKYTGQTYLAFLCATRTMHFYNRLLTTDEPIPLLMEENGLTNYKTFIRTFKEMYGTTPQKVRATQTK